MMLIVVFPVQHPMGVWTPETPPVAADHGVLLAIRRAIRAAPNAIVSTSCTAALVFESYLINPFERLCLRCVIGTHNRFALGHTIVRMTGVLSP
jgi:hypothetical protein